MKWRIAAIGKPSLPFARAGIEEYHKRLRRYTPVEIHYASKDLGREANAAHLLKASEGAFRIVLDERGEDWTTEEFASRVASWQLHGVKQVAVLVGGAEGHGESTRAAADCLVRIGAFTLQHELALLLFLEQLYRVHTLLKGEPYHR